MMATTAGGAIAGANSDEYQKDLMKSRMDMAESGMS
jgi:hypothetical protein